MGLTRVSGDIFDPGIVVAGIVTATGFHGPFSGSDGVFTGIITAAGIKVGGAVTITSGGIDCSAGVGTFFDIDVTNEARIGSAVTANSRGIDVTGVVTATKFVGNGEDLTNTGATLSAASGSQRVIVSSLTSGVMTTAATDGDLVWNATTNTLSAANISIASTLTYEDVTNVDSIGIITARKGVHIGSAGSVFSPASNTLALGTNNEERVRITSAGRLGIGDDSPSVIVSIKDTAPKIKFIDSDATGTPETLVDASGGDLILDVDKDNEKGSTLFAVKIDGLEKARITSAGNLGINNISPNARIEITDTSTAQIRLGYNATKYARIGRASSGNYEFFSQENGSPLIFGTAESSDGGGAEKMRIDRYGKVGIGTLAPADDRLTLYDSDNNVGMYFQCPQTGNANNNGLRIGRNPTHAFIWNYYDNPVAIAVNASQRLEVNSSGISVTGEVAASLDYPDIRPTLSLNFATDKKLDSRIRYQRPGSASYIDAKGFVRLVGDNVPRFDHDKDTGECKGLLIEETRTNINQSSTLQWVMTGWNQSRHGYEQYESETAPDGSTNAMLSYPNTGDNGSHYTYISSAGASLTGKRTISAWFKNLGTTTYYPQLRTFGRGNGVAHATFVLTGDGTVSSAGSAKTGATITKYPNGWYRCTLSWDDSTGHYGGGWVIGNHTSNELPSYVADTNKLKGFLVWGFQSEVGAFSTSYIPTDIVQVTRGSEECVIEGTNFSDVYNATESSVYAEGIMKVSATIDGQYNIFNVGDSNNDGHGVFREHGGHDVWYHMRSGSSTPSGGNLNPSAFGDWDENEYARIAIAFKSGDQAISVNGGNQVTATVSSGYPSSNITKMWIGSAGASGSGQFNGWISKVLYYPKQLSDAQLNTLTAN